MRVTVAEIALHSRTWAVSSGQQRTIVKQPETSRERDAFRLLRSRGSPRLQAYLPTLETDLDDSGYIELAAIPRARTLREEASRSSMLNAVLLASIGTGLRHIHLVEVPGSSDIGSEASRANPSDRLLADTPWVLGLTQPSSGVLTSASVGSLELVKELQRSRDLHALLAAAKSDWEPAGFVHNDLKWDNILVHPKEAEAEPTEVKIIDWEMAGIGDPCWDVGTVLSEFVAFWTLSIPIIDGEPYEDLARYPIEEMQPAIRAFWDSYARAMGFDRATARERLIKSVRFAGTRLIQTAYERTKTMTHLTPHIYLLLQLSLNIMEGPEDAAEGLFGIPLPDRAAT